MKIQSDKVCKGLSAEQTISLFLMPLLPPFPGLKHVPILATRGHLSKVVLRCCKQKELMWKWSFIPELGSDYIVGYR